MKRFHGFTLLEVTIALAFLAIALIPVCLMFVSSYEGSEHVGSYDQAFNLTQDLMEEITSKAYEDPSAGAGSFGTEEATRISYDDIDDFDNHGPFSPPQDSYGVDLSQYAAFTRSASVINVTDVATGNMPRGSLTAQSDGSTAFKLITVTVSWNDGKQSQTLERIAAQYQ